MAEAKQTKGVAGRAKGGKRRAALRRKKQPPAGAAAEEEALAAENAEAAEAEAAAEPAPRKRRRKAEGPSRGSTANDDDAGGAAPTIGRSATIVLFYQYKEPPWSPEEHKEMLAWAEKSGKRHGLGGRMRIAREGFNCTLTGKPGNPGVRGWCKLLQEKFPDPFSKTEFKFTDGLDKKVAWTDLQVMAAEEIVGYGLAGELAPPLSKGGVHLEPQDFHKQLSEPNTVVVDIRNSYEVDIGRFVPPEGTEFINPKMRRSTDLPAWLSRSDVQEQLQGKNVMMYCTGGIRCERASSLLRHQMGDQVQNVYQLQGGIDKYLKEFNKDGGCWQGQNYVFDKRFYHGAAEKAKTEVLGQCIRCSKPWDDYRAAFRCDTCGVPVLVCDNCAEAAKASVLGKPTRCQLCVTERINSKAAFRSEESKRNSKASQGVRRMLQGDKKSAAPAAAAADDVEMEEEEDAAPAAAKGGKLGASPAPVNAKRSAALMSSSGPRGITRLFIGNLSSKRVTQEVLLEAFPGITHIQWLKDKNTGLWYGSVFVEMGSASSAAQALLMDGKEVAQRPVRVKAAPLTGPARWPPLGTAVSESRRPPTASEAAKAKGQVMPLGPKPFPKCRKFLIRGVAKGVTDQEIHQFFGQAKVTAVRWMTDRGTGAFRGCGHVEFASTKDAELAGKRHGRELQGSKILMDWAV